MSTATNGAATEAVFKAITKATKDAGPAVVDATVSVGTAAIGTTAIGTSAIETVSDKPTVDRPGGQAKESGQAWLEASKTITVLSLDAYDASVRAYLDYTESVAAASRASWAMELAQSNTKIVSGLAANYSNAARALLRK